MIRIVPDTNIIISSIFWIGNPHEVIRRGILGEYQLVISADILDEAVNKLRHKFQFPEEKIQELIDIFLMYCEIIEPTSNFDVVRDKKDNKIICCAYDGKVNYVVTGDPDLLILTSFKSIQITTATLFLEQLKKE